MTSTLSPATPSPAAPTSAPPNHRQPSFRYRQNVYFEDGLLATGILSALLFLAVAASFDAAGYIDHLHLLLPVTLGALATSLLMAYSRFDSFFAFSHGMLTGLAWILYLMAAIISPEERALFIRHGFTELQAGVNTVLLRLLQWTQLISDSYATADHYMAIFGLSFLLWWLTYLGIWSIFRYGYTWRVVVPAGVVLLINSFYAPESLLRYLIFFAFVALLLLTRTNLAEQQLRWRIRRTYVSRTVARDGMRTGVSYVVLVLLCAWLFPGLGRNALIQDWLPDIENMLAHIRTTAEEVMDPWSPSNTAPTPTFGESLHLGGERRVGDELIFTVYADQGRYWRAITFDTFTGRTWQNTTTLQVEFPGQSTLPIADWQLREALTQTIVLQESTGHVLLGAPDIFWIDLPVTAKVEPVTAAPLRTSPSPPTAPQLMGSVPMEAILLHAADPLAPGQIYTAISNHTVASEAALRGASTIYPAAVIERYLQLPADFSPQVAALARAIVADGAPTIYDQAKAIEGYLRTIPYNDAIPAPPADVDPVAYFLFELRQGYCNYYATAMATMLRSLGIPARIAGGYAEGTREPGTNKYAVYARDAHTWVEVYFPDYGWIEFEPTAAESALQREPRDQVLPPTPPTPTVPAPLAPVTTTVTPTAFLTVAPTVESTVGTGGDPSTGVPETTGQPWWLWALLTPPLLLLTLWSLRHTPMFAPITFTVDQPLILYERLLDWTQRIGIHLPVSDTPYEQGRRLGRRLPEGRSLIGQIIHAYVLYRFRDPMSARAADDEAENASLQSAWRSLEVILRKSWLRRIYRTTIRRN